MQFQRYNWAIERGGWILLSAFILAASLGLFGVGPLSAGSSRNVSSGLTLHYQRLQRYGADTELVIDLPSAGGAKLLIDNTLLEDYSIRSLVPTPRRSSSQGGKIVFEFERHTDTSSRIFMGLHAERAGRVDLLVRDGSGASAPLHALIFP